MFQWMFLPLDEHVDFGLGATGEAFRHAAKVASESAKAPRALYGHLAVNFLFRHASELFLKSMVVVLHRTLEVPYGNNESNGPPFVLREDKWVPLDRVHSLAVIWAHVSELMRDNATELARRCTTDWQATPPELPAGIARIEAADATSTYFRYPSVRSVEANREKSAWKQTTAQSAQGSMRENAGRHGKFFVVYGDNETIDRIYQLDDDPMSEVARALREVADLLAGAVFGLRAELTDGR